MKQILNPSLEDVRLECVLMQAWKKTSSYLRTHSWYADTLGIDYQSLRIPAFLAEIQEAVDSYADWTPQPLELVPAPKTQRWCFDDRWKLDSGGRIEDYQKKLRPLAHVALRDQVVATAIMLCLADRIETRMNDPRLSIDSEENRRRVLAYGHRLVCDDADDGGLRHRWGSYQAVSPVFPRLPDVSSSSTSRGGARWTWARRSSRSRLYRAICRSSTTASRPDLLRQKFEQLQTRRR